MSLDRSAQIKKNQDLALVRESFHIWGEIAARQLGEQKGLSAFEIDYCCDGRDQEWDGERHQFVVVGNH